MLALEKHYFLWGPSPRAFYREMTGTPDLDGMVKWWLDLLKDINTQLKVDHSAYMIQFISCEWRGELNFCNRWAKMNPEVLPRLSMETAARLLSIELFNLETQKRDFMEKVLANSGAALNTEWRDLAQPDREQYVLKSIRMSDFVGTGDVKNLFRVSLHSFLKDR